MILSMIVAMTPDRVIGDDNRLLWHLRTDMQRFKKLTMGKTVIMGRKTFDSIGGVLEGRTNIVLTRKLSSSVYRKYDENTTLIKSTSLKNALEKVQNEEEVFIIGGAAIYKEAMPLINKLYLTTVNSSQLGDTKLPRWDPDMIFRRYTQTIWIPADKFNDYHHRFQIFEIERRV